MKLGIVFDNIDLAKKALSCLKTHYNIYKYMDSYKFRRDGDEKLTDKLNTYKWFTFFKEQNKYTDEELLNGTCSPWVYSIPVEVSLGEYRDMHTGMWCGYFETLFSAEVIPIGGVRYEGGVLNEEM